MSNGAEDLTLADRVEFPTIPKSARTKIANLQEQFIRAEVEQCKFQLSFFLGSRLWFYRGARMKILRVVQLRTTPARWR